MDLSILTSKKGTKVVKSSQLHRVLGLNDNHYPTNIKRWLGDVYQFADAIRKPAGMADYARAKMGPQVLLKEYYLSLEFARLITLASRSKVKQAIANKLAREEAAYPQHLSLNGTEMLTLLEQVKAMTRLSCQKAALQRHRAAYNRRRGNADFWNHYRSQFVGYKKDELLQQLRLRGIKARKSGTIADLLLQYDAYELIRIGIVDHYAATGHPLTYAKQIGLIGKQLAEQMRLEVVDDTLGEQLFTTPVDADMVANLRGVAA